MTDRSNSPARLKKNYRKERLALKAMMRKVGATKHVKVIQTSNEPLTFTVQWVKPTETDRLEEALKMFPSPLRQPENRLSLEETPREGMVLRPTGTPELFLE